MLDSGGVGNLKVLRPGQEVTKDLLARYGASLSCVRYRYDEDNHESLKTVEPVVQRRSREREAKRPGSRKPAGQAGDDAWRGVALRIGWRGWPDSAMRVWVLRRNMTERLDLLH